MGIANIIPGVSGGTLALTLGIYEDLIGAISHFFSKLKENIIFLVPVFLGMGASILSMSNLISYSFEHYALCTSMLFMGLVLGGIPMLYDKVKVKKKPKKKQHCEISSSVIFLFTFVLVMILAFAEEIFGSGVQGVELSINVFSFIKMFFIGVIAASTMIIPGVSGSLVLMLVGYYTPIINAIKDLTHFTNLGVCLSNLAFFGIGVVIGIVVVAKVLEYLFQKYERKTYFGVLGFIVASVIAIPVSVVHEYGSFAFGFLPIIIGLALMAAGAYIGYKLGEK